MPLDGALLYKLKNEINLYIGSHLDKIYQPSRDELVFLLRSKEGAKRLLISAKPGSARVHFTEIKPENPPSPPMFCMLLRKYLGAARLIEVQQEGLERVLTLVFTSTNEMGDVIYPRLICELIGNQPNIILADENGIIIDAVRRSDIEASVRMIQPGACYTSPAKTEKANILSQKTEDITAAVLTKAELPLSKAILDTVGGVSPLVAREVALRIADDFDKPVSSLTKGERMNITGALNSLLRDILNNIRPTVLTDQKGIPKDFSFMPITQYGKEFKEKLYYSFGEALDAFYRERENAERLHRAAQDLFKLLSVLITRTERKTALRKKDLLACADREKYRIYGELLKANLYAVKSGSSSVSVQNYYDENLSEITIPLDPALSPAANADKYFKEYKKSYTAEKMLKRLIEEDRRDLEYYDSVLDALSRAESIFELNEIREELYLSGLIRSDKKTKLKKENDSFREYTTPDGYKILVGKNNRQNDRLSLSVASKGDIWFHTKNIPGSHTVLLSNGQSVSDEALLFTAKIAAYHSKAQSSSGVPVDYTLIKYVKKPSGAKPGMVIYSNEKTLYVTPELPF
ncbi:MAG: NFACT family protein [Clostridia bacterium]|nr:NFACT family protein [Clostridia bacterium]